MGASIYKACRKSCQRINEGLKIGDVFYKIIGNWDVGGLVELRKIKLTAAEKIPFNVHIRCISIFRAYCASVGEPGRELTSVLIR